MQRIHLLNWLRRGRKETPAASLGALHILRPWARSSATSPWTGGGYMTIVNDGPADRLRSAHSEDAGWIEIHGIRVVGPALEMRVLDRPLAIPNGTTILKPRGHHLLLLGLPAPLVAGTRLPLTLHFERAGSLDLDFLVEAPGIVGAQALHMENAAG
jgi:copper(I)-binding protein